MMFINECRYKEESMRVERFLAIKNRPLGGYYFDSSQIKVDLSYPDNVHSKKGKFITILILMFVNLLFVLLPISILGVIVTIVGAFTSPLVIFILPGYLYYNHACENQVKNLHRRLSLALVIFGTILLFFMTTISFYVIRA